MCLLKIFSDRLQEYQKVILQFSSELLHPSFPLSTAHSLCFFLLPSNTISGSRNKIGRGSAEGHSSHRAIKTSLAHSPLPASPVWEVKRSNLMLHWLKKDKPGWIITQKDNNQQSPVWKKKKCKVYICLSKLLTASPLRLPNVYSCTVQPERKRTHKLNYSMKKSYCQCWREVPQTQRRSVRQCYLGLSQKQ